MMSILIYNNAPVFGFFTRGNVVLCSGRSEVSSISKALTAAFLELFDCLTGLDHREEHYGDQQQHR